MYQGNKILGLVIPSQERDLNINGEIVAEIIGLLPDNLNVNNNLWMKKKTRSKKVLIFPQEKIAHDDRKSLLKVRCATTVKPDRTTPGQRLVEDWRLGIHHRKPSVVLYVTYIHPTCLINIDTLSAINMTVSDQNDNTIPIWMCSSSPNVKIPVTFVWTYICFNLVVKKEHRNDLTRDYKITQWLLNCITFLVRLASNADFLPWIWLVFRSMSVNHLTYYYCFSVLLKTASTL